MRRVAITLMVTLFGLAGFGTAGTMSGVAWQTYHNETYGYSADYPAGLFGSPEETEEQDGIMMVSHDGQARLAFFGGHNDAGHTPRSMADTLAAFEEVQDVTYRRVAADWMVLSGYLAQPEDGTDMIFYWRVNFGPGDESVSGFRLEYPVDQRDRYDGLIGRIGRSLTVATLD